jgi:hypothetical protein
MSVTSQSGGASGATADGVHAALKVNTPDTFTGDQRKLRAFLAQCDMYIRFNASRLGTPEAKVMFAAIYLRNRAFD